MNFMLNRLAAIPCVMFMVINIGWQMVMIGVGQSMAVFHGGSRGDTKTKILNRHSVLFLL
jgi:hypothetical protein